MNHEIGGNIQCKTVNEEDFVVTMNADTKVPEKCRIAASSGTYVLGMIQRNV